MKILKGTKRLYMLLLVPFLFCFFNCAENHNATDISFKINSPQKPSPSSAAKFYKWVKNYDSTQTVFSRFTAPAGYEIETDTARSFSNWLLHLPLKKDGAPVLLYNGQQKNRQDVHAAVIDIDAGTKDLQQCADAVMRLRAEYLFGNDRKKEISFCYTSGDKIPFEKWCSGYRPSVKGNSVKWNKSGAEGNDYPNFKGYLWNVFNYAGSKSLSKEMKAVSDFNTIKAGDVLIIGGFPGHAVTVIATAINKKNGKKIFMLAQSYMPAQEIHIVKNFENESVSPWYEIPAGDVIETPEWTFTKQNLMRW